MSFYDQISNALERIDRFNESVRAGALFGILPGQVLINFERRRVCFSSQPSVEAFKGAYPEWTVDFIGEIAS